MRIAILIYELSVGGAQRRTATLARALAERGHDVRLLVVRPGGALESELGGRVSIEPVGLAPGLLRRRLKRRFQLRASVPRIAYRLLATRPDVFLSAASHANRIAPFAWLLSGARARLVLRVSNHLSGSAGNHVRPPLPGRYRLARVCYRLASDVVSVSRGVAEDLIAVTGLAPERVHTISNPVVTPQLLEQVGEPLCHPWFAPGSPPVLLGVGRLVAQKDFATLLRAFARLREDRDLRLLILGEGSRRAALEGLAVELGVAAHVAMPGNVPNPLPYMTRAAALVLSSAWEGLPGVLIEALACGCPVVSTDCPSGPAEILQGGRLGPLVPVGDDAALAAAVAGVLARPPEREALRARAADFSLSRSVDAYERVLRGHAQPAPAAPGTEPAAGASSG